MREIVALCGRLLLYAGDCLFYAGDCCSTQQIIVLCGRLFSVWEIVIL